MPPRNRLGKPPPVPRAPRPVRVAKPPTARIANKALDEIIAKAKKEAGGPPISRRARPASSSVNQPANQVRSRRSGNELPTASELLAAEHTPTAQSRMPTADELLELGGGGVELPPENLRYLSPTASSNPERPRTLEASYDPDRRVMSITYRNGGTYEYSGVPANVWYRFGRVVSPGKFIDRNIKGVFPYERVGAG